VTPYSRDEIRTGLVIVGAAIIAFAAIFVVGDFKSFFTPKVRYHVIFDRSHGIKRYADVRYAGVKVGEVKGIRISTGTPQQVVLDVEVRRDADIRQGAEAEIKTLGFLGERYVEINPPDETGPPLPEGATLRGRSSTQLEDMGTIMGDLADQIGRTREQLDKIIGDERFREDLKSTVHRASELTGEMKDMLAENRPALRESLRHTRSASAEVDTILKEHRQEISSAIKDLASLADKMDAAADDLEALAKKSRGLIDRNEASIDRTIADLRTTAANMRELSTELKHNPSKLIKIFPSIFHWKHKEAEPPPEAGAPPPAATKASP
jgi:phospholipid/cholesterol/gamma-HCH transport system substrate-binding protein